MAKQLRPQPLTRSNVRHSLDHESIEASTGSNFVFQETVQVLILPALILIWGLAVVTIAATVG